MMPSLISEPTVSSPNPQPIISASDLTTALRANEPVGDRFSNRIVDGEVNLDSIAFSHKLVVQNSTFRGRFNGRESRFARTLDLSGCTFEQGLSFEGARVEGELILDGATIKARTGEQSSADLSQVSIGRNFIAKTITVEGPSLSLQGATVAGDAVVRGAHIAGKLTLEAAHIGGNLQCQPWEGRRTEIGGEATLRETKVAGAVQFTGAAIQMSLNLQDADIGGSLFCQPWERQRTEIGGQAWLSGAKVAGQAIFSGAAIKGGMLLQKADIVGGLLCRMWEGQRTEFGGRVSLDGANVGSHAEFSGAAVQGDLNLQNANIQGTLFCTSIEGQRAEIGGLAWLSRAKVAGQVVFSGAAVQGDLAILDAEIGMSLICEGTAIQGCLNLQYADIQGDVLCGPSDGKRTEVGAAWLRGAKVAGQVVFNGASIRGDLILQDADIGEGLFCNPDAGQRTEIGGRASLMGAKIAGQALFQGVAIRGDLNLQAVTIGEAVKCSQDGGERTEIGGNVSLRMARIGWVGLDGRCFNGKLILELAQFTHLQIDGALPEVILNSGLQFKDVRLPDGDYQGFLAASQPFQKSTYQFFENWFRNRGEDEKAKAVYLAMRRRDRLDGGLGRVGALWDWFLDWSVRYGLETHRLFYVYLPMFLLCFLVFACGQGAMERVHDAGSPATVTQPATWYDAFWLSVQTHLPMIQVLPAKGWQATANYITLWGWGFPLAYDAFATVLMLVSIVLVPLFFASISGLLKKE